MKTILLILLAKFIFPAFQDLDIHTQSLMLARAGIASKKLLPLQNPSTITFLEKKSFIIEYKKPFLGMHQNLDIAGHYPIDINEAIFGFVFQTSALNSGLLVSARTTEPYKESIIFIPIGLEIKNIIKEEMEKIAFGLNLKLMTINYFNEHIITQPELDVGIFYAPKSDISIATVAKNLIGTNFSNISFQRTPIEFVVGFSKIIKNLNFLMDIKYRNNLTFSIGTIINITKTMNVSFGLSRSEIASGISLNLKRCIINYSLTIPYNLKKISTNNSFGVNIHF